MTRDELIMQVEFTFNIKLINIIYYHLKLIIKK